jgi:YD repeat-containing protein
LDRITQLTDTINGATAFTYDANSNLLTVTDDCPVRLLGRDIAFVSPVVFPLQANSSLVPRTTFRPKGKQQE